MYAVEFEAEIRNGVVKIPDAYGRLKNARAKVVVLLEDEELARASTSDSEGIDFGECNIEAFEDTDGVSYQREMRDDW